MIRANLSVCSIPNMQMTSFLTIWILYFLYCSLTLLLEHHYLSHIRHIVRCGPPSLRT